MIRRRWSALAVAATLAALAPACDLRDALPPGPAAAARAADAARADQLRAHLVALPAVTDASIIVERAPIDPLARATPAAAPATVAVAVVATAGADPAVLDDAARTAAAALLGPDARVAVAIVPAPAGPDLARLGPFTVEAGARGPLLALLAGALVVIAALATALALVLARRAAPPAT